MNLLFSYISNSEYGDIKKFLKKLLMLSILIFVLDKALAFWATQAVLHDTRAFGSLSLLYRGVIDHQIVLFGSSKTHVNIDAESIEQQTSMTCHNLAIGNASIDMCEFLFEEFLSKNRKPKIVFMEADFAQLQGGLQFRSELIAPFSNVSANTAERLNPTLANQLAFWFFRCKNFSAGEGIGALSRSMFRYAQDIFRGNESDDLTQQSGTAGYQDNHQWRDANGSHLLAPLERDMSKVLFRKEEGQNSHVSLQRQEIYLRMVELTKSEGIQLVLYGPPLFGELNKNLAQQVDQFFSRLAEQNEHVHYWTFREVPDLLADPNLWTDGVHMNWNGAEILTQKIVTKLETLRN